MPKNQKVVANLANAASMKQEKQLSFLDKYLTIWIFSAMFIGVGLGYFFPNFSLVINSMQSGSTNLPIALGLIVMMYPPLAKVKYEEIGKILKHPKILLIGLFQSWIVGPLVMFFLAILFFPNNQQYMSGLILIGIAPCIAMVLVWNDLAKGDNELAAGMVALNSVLQILFYSIYAYFFISILPPYFGIKSFEIQISMYSIAKSVFTYLGIPFFAGIISRYILIKIKGIRWFEDVYIPKISPLTLLALLLTIITMFALKGKMFITIPFDVIKVSIPLLLFFTIMFFVTFYLIKFYKGNYKETTTIAFTASSNNFELGIAVAIAIFGINSGAAFAAVIGPLIEVPALILLVKFALKNKNKFSHE